MSAVPLTCRLVTEPPKPCLTPSQRCWRPMLFASWMTQRTFLTPSLFRRCPAARPAIVSVWPTWVIAPSASESSAPELSVMIGMPAALALASEPLIALALGTETARPSTFWETAASISCACFCGSLLEGLQMSLTPSSLAACWAPFLTTDQNDPSSLCVTIAKVSPLPWVCSTVSVPPAGVDVLDLLLEEPHPAAMSAATASARVSRRVMGRASWEPVRSARYAALLACVLLAGGCGGSPPAVLRVSAGDGLVPALATGVAIGGDRVLTVAHALSGRVRV